MIQTMEASDLSVDELAQLLGIKLETEPPLLKSERALLLAEKLWTPSGESAPGVGACSTLTKG